MSGSNEPSFHKAIDDVNSLLQAAVAHLNLTIKRLPGGLPKAGPSLQIILSLLELSLDKTRKQVAVEELGDQRYKALLSDLRACQIKLEKLIASFKKTESAQTSWRRWSFSKSDSFRIRNVDAKNLAIEILKCHISMCNSGVIPPTAEETSHMISTVQMALDQDIQTLIEKLRVGDLS